MSTTAAIGATTKEGWTGVSSYSDGYPLMQGRGLMFIYRHWWKGDVNGFVKWATGHRWRTFLQRNAALRPTHVGIPGFNKDAERLTEVYEAMGKGLPPECYCHGSDPEEIDTVTHRNNEGCHWAYVIDAPRHRMRVLKRAGSGWEQVASINLDGKEPNWGAVECGKKQERCTHSAGHHERSVIGSNGYFMEWERMAEGWKAKEDASFLRGVLTSEGAKNVKGTGA